MAAFLVVPALAAIAPAITERGARLFSLAAAFLYVGSLAGIILFTQMIFQNTVLTSLPGQLIALQVAEAIQASPHWQIPAIPSLVGLLVGFLLLGLAVWRPPRAPGGYRDRRRTPAPHHRWRLVRHRTWPVH